MGAVILEAYKYANPFYDNHVFTALDKKRSRLSVSDRLRVWWRPMLVQITDGSVVKFKRDGEGRYYIFGWEELPHG